MIDDIYYQLFVTLLEQSVFSGYTFYLNFTLNVRSRIKGFHQQKLLKLLSRGNPYI